MVTLKHYFFPEEPIPRTQVERRKTSPYFSSKYSKEGTVLFGETNPALGGGVGWLRRQWCFRKCSQFQAGHVQWPQGSASCPGGLYLQPSHWDPTAGGHQHERARGQFSSHWGALPVAGEPCGHVLTLECEESCGGTAVIEGGPLPRECTQHCTRGRVGSPGAVPALQCTCSHSFAKGSV